MDAPETPLIEFRAVSKGFGGPPVLDALDLAVAAGESLVILGPSGTGKSVLLKTLIGLMRPDGGEVRVEGARVDDKPESALVELRRRISYCFQNGALFDSMSVEENLAFPLREHRAAEPDEIRARVADALARVGLEGKQGVMPAELSGGMRKRAAFARAVITRPAVILYDEPTAGLDPITARQINALMVEIGRGNGAGPITALTVTHDIESALSVGRRVALLDRGKIAFSGGWDDAFGSEQPLLRAFLQGHEAPEARSRGTA